MQTLRLSSGNPCRRARACIKKGFSMPMREKHTARDCSGAPKHSLRPLPQREAMVPWLAFGLLFPLMYAVSNIIDKLLLESRVKNIYSQALIGGACYLLFAALVMAFHPLGSLPREGVLLALSTGLVLAVSIIGY